jgi:hypothetical protein
MTDGLLANAYLTKSVTTHRRQLKDEVTVVTGYFNIGSFVKFAEWDVFTPQRYHRWMAVFAKITSPVIAFFDTDEDLEVFSRLRRHLPSNLTVIHKVDRRKVSGKRAYCQHPPRIYQPAALIPPTDVATSDDFVKENENKNEVHLFVIRENENRNDNYFDNENRIRKKIISTK